MEQIVNLSPAILPTGELLYTTLEEAAALNLQMLQRLIARVLSMALEKGVRALLNQPKPMAPAAVLAELAAVVEQHRPTRR